ncbi:MAG: NADH-quinone oxidoreductase subunit NuoE [Candidatus Sumerlaeia bacterium]|nr:NADH-quinone oxidoreductase subunit NuoE [Candidatus Sumerlaeia bacterium]
MNILKDETERIERLFEKYPSRRSAMLPLLWMVQEKTGWVSQEAMEEVAEILAVTPAEVYEVVSFYTMFQQRPTGKTHIALCDTLACAICGTHEIAAYLEEKYGIEVKKVTKDGRFSLELVECIGACSMAPALLANEDLHGNLTPESLDQLIASCP